MAVTALKPPAKSAAKAPARPDPVLAALIAKLPPGGSDWPLDRRTAWLKMMWMAFDVVYAGAGDAPIEMPAFLGGGRAKNGAQNPGLRNAQEVDDAPVITQSDRPFQPMGGHAFYVDRAGRACRAGGGPIMPTELGGATLYDMRGEAGDLGAITWADGSTGVRGLQLAISAAKA